LSEKVRKLGVPVPSPAHPVSLTYTFFIRNFAITQSPVEPMSGFACQCFWLATGPLHCVSSYTMSVQFAGMVDVVVVVVVVVGVVVVVVNTTSWPLEH